MPQKRNPDGMELVRGAAGLLLGDSFAFSCVLKGLPSTYNKDLQSDKEILFRSYDRLLDCLKVTTGSIQTMEVRFTKVQHFVFHAQFISSPSTFLQVNAERATSSLDPSMLATDLAHVLVRRGVPFRTAHHLVGTALRKASALKVDLKNFPYKEYMKIW